MLHQKILARVIGVSQLVLGFGFLFIPDIFFSAFGFSPALPDQKYLFGQLAARFFAFGIAMFIIARNLGALRFGWDLMAMVQLIDLAVGLFFVLANGGRWEVAAFPMANAAVFSILLVLWRPKTEGASKG